jgi:signal transduction histidine kinase
MDKMIRDMINFTAPRKRRRQHSDIQKAISDVLTLVSRQMARQHIKVSTQFSEDIPRCFMDERQMKQVFLNLFKNAIEAMPGGGMLTLRTRLLREDGAPLSEGSSEKAVVVEMSDTGVGISEDELNLIFKPFYTTKESGTGLGLSICRTIIEEHFGSIKVESSVGKGSTFALVLPLEGANHGKV